MKLKKYLNESSKVAFALSSSYNDKPRDEYKHSFYFYARELKKEITDYINKGGKDTDKMQSIINTYSRKGMYKFVDTVTVDNTKWYKFEGYNVDLWISPDHDDNDVIYKLSLDFPAGTIFVDNWGSTMSLYDFYRVDGYTKSMIVLSKLEKSRNGEIVKPTNKVESTQKFKILTRTGSDECFVKIASYDYLHLRKEDVYDPSREYEQDTYD